MKPLSTGNNLTAGTKTTVYTVPTGYYAKWSLCYISNHTGSNKSVSVWWYDSSSTNEITIIDDYNLDARKFLQFGGGGAYVVLEEGDQVRITTETGSSMSATNTFELYRKGE
jgi:hypothetical protein